jgi:hypothetical protein
MRSDPFPESTPIIRGEYAWIDRFERPTGMRAVDAVGADREFAEDRPKQ